MKVETLSEFCSRTLTCGDKNYQWDVGNPCGYNGPGWNVLKEPWCADQWNYKERIAICPKCRASTCFAWYHESLSQEEAVKLSRRGAEVNIMTLAFNNQR